MDDPHKHDNMEARSFQDRPIAGTVSSVSNLDWRTDLKKEKSLMLLSWLGGTDRHQRFLSTFGTVRERRDTAVHKETLTNKMKIFTGQYHHGVPFNPHNTQFWF